MQSIFNELFYLIFEPIINFMSQDVGIDLIGSDFKIGFGNIEWFSMDLYQLFSLIGALIISITYIILIFKVFKFFTKLVSRAFGDRKW